MSLHFNLADLFECVADAVPDREALVYGDRRLTFAELDARANRFAHFLQSRGVGSGDHVGIYAYNCNEWVEAAYAAFKIRAVPININFRYVEDELRYLIEDADLVALVYHAELAARVASVAPNCPKLHTLVVIEDRSPASSLPLSTPMERGPGGEVNYESAIVDQSPKRDFPERSCDDLYVIYTGGTTGMPKGVMWRHEDVFFAGLQGGNPGGPPIAAPEDIGPAAAARTAAPTTMPVAPLMHGNGFWSVVIGMNGGGKAVLAQSRRMDPSEIWSLVGAEKINVMSIVGDAMARPMTEALYEDGAEYDLSSLMVISSAGAIWSEHVKERMRGKLGCLLIDAFGATESGHQGMNLGPHAGRPTFSVDANTAVLDDDLRRIAPGSETVGRLARTGRLPLGYWKDAEKTAKTFMTDPDGVRWVIPGDMATIAADGVVTLLGRGSLCINSGGEKIYPEEVEQALKAHPAVFDAVVVGVPDERWGERVAAVVQPREGTVPTLADLDTHCRTKVSGYKVPRELHLVDEIVRSPSGKADYRWAKARAMETGSETRDA